MLLNHRPQEQWGRAKCKCTWLILVTTSVFRMMESLTFETYLLRLTCVSLLWKSEAASEKFFTAENKESFKNTKVEGQLVSAAYFTCSLSCCPHSREIWVNSVAPSCRSMEIIRKYYNKETVYIYILYKSI